MPPTMAMAEHHHGVVTTADAGASSSVNNPLKTSSQQYLSGAKFVPELSFKTSGSFDAKSITPDKHDVIMDEANDGAASAAGSDSGSDNAAVPVASGGGDVEDAAASGEENSRDVGDKDVAMGEAGDNSEAEEAAKGNDNGEDNAGEASPQSSPMDRLAEAVDRRADGTTDKSGEGAEAEMKANKSAGESKKSDSTKHAGDEKKNTATSGETKNGNGKEEKSDNAAAKDSNKKSGPKKDSDKNPDGEEEKEPAVPEAPLPLLVGTLAYSDRDNLRRHIIRGNWKYENSHAVPPQRFELIRTIPPEEDLKELPKDGEFSGSFNVQLAMKSKKGTIKMKNRAVAESGVKLTFKPKEEDEGMFAVNGTGINEYGVFELFGTAKENTGVDVGEDPTYSVSVHKRYVGPPAKAAAVPNSAKEGGNPKVKKRKHEGDADDEPKVLPTELPTEGVCLQGKLVRNTSDELSLDNAAVHRITGLWAMKGLSKILEEPDACEKFEYEHKCSGDSTVFPLSGRYTGFFYVNEAGERTKIPERDVILKFKPNTDGYWNVDGKGSNIFGRYNITGKLTKEGEITLFRIFQALKVKASKKSTQVKISAPKAANGSSAKAPPKTGTAVSAAVPSSLLSFDDIDLPDEDEVPAPLTPPEQFSAISRGILKIDNDGTHTCSGNWALSNDHFSGGITSKFHFGIDTHAAAEGAKVMLDTLDEDDDRKIKNISSDGVTPSTLANSTFPIDSTQYRGNFKLRKGQRTQTIADQQIVLKYVKNSGGSYNVYGKGTNEVGTFDLVGTLILQGKSNGLMQVYRIYPPAPEHLPAAPRGGMSKKSSKVFQGGLTEKATKENSGPAPAMRPPERFVPSMSGLQRRESSRMSRLPSRLEEDNPQAEMERHMERCRQIINELQTADTNKIFALPVDPIALGVPQYFDIVEHPMDLGTIKTRIDNNAIDSPEEFARLVRLTFQNAITFNNLPDNPVHIFSRGLLVLFNKKFGSIDKAFNAAKKNKKLTKVERQDARRKEKDAAKDNKRKEKQEKERKRKAELEATNESKRMKLENVVAANKSAMAAISAAAPNDPDATVTREEYSLLLQAIRQVQDQIVGLHKIIKKGSKSSADASSSYKATSDASFGYVPSYAADVPSQSTSQSSKPKKKKAKKEVEQPSSPPRSPSPRVTFPDQAPVVEDLQPLTFEEQEALSESINLLPERLLPGAMQIIRESEIVNDDDDEIDLDIDQLDTKTQRKLQGFVMENVKQKKKKKQPKKPKAASASAPASPAPANSPSPPPAEEKTESSSKPRPPGGKSFGLPGFDDDSDDDQEEEEDEEEDIKTDFATNWVANPNEEKEAAGDDSDKDDEGDDLWGEAKREAEAAKVREADRLKREEKMQAEARLREQQRMAEAQELGEQTRAKRLEEKAAEDRLLEQQEKEAEDAREAAREQARQEVEEEQQTVDMDATRDLMAKYEEEFNDNYSAGASPSSDFGF